MVAPSYDKSSLLLQNGLQVCCNQQLLAGGTKLLGAGVSSYLDTSYLQGTDLHAFTLL